MNDATQTRPWLLIAGGVIMTVLAAGIWWQYADGLPSPNGDVDKVAAFITSEEFDDLPTYRKQAYYDAIDRAREEGRLEDAGEDAQRLAMRSEWREAMEQVQGVYFAMPQNRRDAFIKEIVDQQQAAMAKMMAARVTGKSRDEMRQMMRDEMSSFRQRMQERLAEMGGGQEVDAGLTANMPMFAEFHSAMRREMDARGMPRWGR